MTYSHRNLAEERKEACLKVEKLAAICKELSITLDPVDWQNSGMRAWVSVNNIKIAELLDFGQHESISILRRIQMKLLEHAALEAIRAQPGIKALMWTPVDAVQPQEFASLWILTIETGERVAIAEYIKDGQRLYENFKLDVTSKQALAKLLGPAHTGEYELGATVNIEEREKKASGTIVYILSPGKVSTNRKYVSRGSQGSPRPSPNDTTSRYLVDCNDGFPHIVNQSQVSLPVTEEPAATDGKSLVTP